MLKQAISFGIKEIHFPSTLPSYMQVEMVDIAILHKKIFFKNCETVF